MCRDLRTLRECAGLIVKSKPGQGFAEVDPRWPLTCGEVVRAGPPDDGGLSLSVEDEEVVMGIGGG
eukprot:7611763-Pyramimonas_sp.AAC.1